VNAVPLTTRLDGRAPASSDKLVSRRILVLANLLRRAASLRYRRLLRLAGVEWGLVAHVGLGKPQTLNQIAHGMGLEKAQLSRTVSSLVKRGLLSKKSNPRNRREVLIALTGEGRRQHRIIRAAGEAANDRLLAKLSEEARAAFVTRIEHLTAHARELLELEQAASRNPSDGKAKRVFKSAQGPVRGKRRSIPSV
jgi:DNA-binding MarR family transcriptional regulator